MKNLTRQLTFVFLGASVSLALGLGAAACGTGFRGSSLNANTPLVQVGGDGATAKSPTAGEPAAPLVPEPEAKTELKGPESCPNPIALDEPGLTPASDPLALVTDRPLRIQSITVHTAYGSDAEALTIQATSSDSFQLQIACDTASRKLNSIRGAFQISDRITPSEPTYADSQRQIRFRFEGGRLTELVSELVLAAPHQRALSDTPTLERIEVGHQSYLTYRVYALADGRVEQRSRLELAPDADGRQVVQTSRVVFVAE